MRVTRGLLRKGGNRSQCNPCTRPPISTSIARVITSRADHPHPFRRAALRCHTAVCLVPFRFCFQLGVDPTPPVPPVISVVFDDTGDAEHRVSFEGGAWALAQISSFHF